MTKNYIIGGMGLDSSSSLVQDFAVWIVILTYYCSKINQYAPTGHFILIFSSSDHQWISVPSALSNPAVSDISVTAHKAIYQTPWLGKINPDDRWLWADNFCLLVS